MPEEGSRLVQPREHKAKVSIWVDLNLSDVDQLDEANTPEQIKQELSQIFDAPNYQEDHKTGILIDLFYHVIQFCRENSFTQEQTSAFFSIVKKTHEICTETPFGNVQQCFSFFKEAVLCHAVKRPPFSIDLFNADEVSKITDYMLNTYFRHFKMYKYVFTPLVRLDLSINYEGMPETPPPSEHDETERDETKELGLDDNIKEEDDEHKPKTSVQEESEAAKELRQLIREHLSEELKKLKLSVDEQIKESEEVLNQKLSEVESSAGVTGRRSAGRLRRK